MSSFVAEAVTHATLLSWHAPHLVFHLQLLSKHMGGEEASLSCSLDSELLCIDGVGCIDDLEADKSIFILRLRSPKMAQCRT